MRRIAVSNQKGGVGKTTTTANLAAALADAGQRVVLIDLDPQGHLSLHFGVELAEGDPTIYDVLIDSMPVREVIRPVGPNLSLLAAQTDLAAAETELVTVVGREVILRDAMAAVSDDYDVLLIDCPPSLSLLTINALVATDEVLIPLQAHFLGLQGLSKLIETVTIVRRRVNPRLCVGGIVLCMYDAGTKLAGEVVEDLSSFLAAARGTESVCATARLFDARIRRNIKLAEAPSHGQTVLAYDPTSNGAEDYRSLARELLAHDPFRPYEAPVAKVQEVIAEASAPRAQVEAAAAVSHAPAPTTESTMSDAEAAAQSADGRPPATARIIERGRSRGGTAQKPPAPPTPGPRNGSRARPAHPSGDLPAPIVIDPS
jgi:chromosome partitioning protein